MGLGQKKTLHSDPQSGITLIEVLVTMFVIALATSAIMLNLPPSPPPLERAELRLEDFVPRVFENAQLRGQEYTINLDMDRFVVLKREGEVWQEVDHTPLPKGVSGYQESNPDAEKPEKDSPEAQIGPHLNIYPLGFMESGVWVLEYLGEEKRKLVTKDGTVKDEEAPRRRRRFG